MAIPCCSLSTPILRVLGTQRTMSPALCPSAWKLFLPHFDLLILFASFTTSSGKPLTFPVSALPLPRVQHSLCAVIVCLCMGFYIGLGAMRGGQGNHTPDQDLEYSSFRRRLPRVPSGVSLPPQSHHPDFSYQRLVLSIIKFHIDGLTQCVVFCIWRPCLTLGLWDSYCGCINQWLILFHCWVVLHTVPWLYQLLFIHSPVDRHLDS